MRPYRVGMVLPGVLVLVVVAACTTPPRVAGAAEARTARAATVTQAGTWTKAMQVPGLAALNKGGNAEVSSVSCASVGNCSAGGYYANGSGYSQVFVVSERNGTWGKAIEVPGSAALNTGGDGLGILSVSCASAGNCSAGGYYSNTSHPQVFVVSERNGAWGKAIDVPGLGALNTGENAEVSSVSCASAGNCAAGGAYSTSYPHSQAFVISERNGAWGKAIEVPGSAALNTGGNASVKSVSCPSAGNCAAAGVYARAGHAAAQVFVISERNGAWGTAIEVPGLGALNTGMDAQVTSVSCPSAGNCAVGGYYEDSSHHPQAFVVSERNGAWGKAIEVPGSAALNTGGNAAVFSQSCPSAGNCSAGGSFSDRSSHFQAFVVSERNGAWGKAIEVPGSAALNAGGDAQVTSVSCPSAGNCTAGGSYWDRFLHPHAFVVSERNSTWGKAMQVPGLAALNRGGGAQVLSVSCPSAGHCVASGSYSASRHIGQAFVVSQP